MGLLIEGAWHVEDPPQIDKGGHWQRSQSLLRNWVTPDGSAGPTGEAGFAADPGRYHLYVAWNCPWAHRALIYLKLKRLEDVIDVSFVRPRRTDQGWVFEKSGEFHDQLFGLDNLHDVYTRSAPEYSGRVTVPVLWDKQCAMIVSNESADIVRMLNSAFAAFAPKTPDYAPEDKLDEIDAWNERIYETVNNGVYRAGFARTQEAYETAAGQVFETLDAIEGQLAKTRFLTGPEPLEADWRLLPTLVRFDVAYVSAFKCNLRRIVDYEYLWPYARRLYQTPGIADTVKLDIYKAGYHSPSPLRNPLGIVPAGPEVDFALPVT
jgi:putative glutathione S-transferase